MTASRALLYYLIALGISIGGLLFMAAWPANAQQAPAPACATLEMRLNEAKKMGIAPHGATMKHKQRLIPLCVIGS